MRDDRSAHWQVENEYGPMESVMGSGAKSYVDWAAKMAVATNAGVPWIMCKQDDAPDPVVIFNCHFPRLFFFFYFSFLTAIVSKKNWSFYKNVTKLSDFLVLGTTFNFLGYIILSFLSK